MSDPQNRPPLGSNMSAKDIRTTRRLTSFAYWMSVLGLAMIGGVILLVVAAFVVVLVVLS